MIRLADLVAGLPIAPPDLGGAADLEVAGVTHDSRRVEPGDLFVAWRGARFDGAAFAPQAVAAGAVAVVASAGSVPPAEVAAAGTPWLTAADPHQLLGPLAARAYGHPDRGLTLAGVTGTNGKSTVAALLTSILTAAGRSSGLLGTLGYDFAGERFGGGRTTPEASDLFRTLRRMHDRGARAAAMEVSSHALALGRVAGVTFDVAVFTNLSRDHLDFHRDLDDYFAAKRRLFSMLKPGGGAAVNVDDPYGARLAAELAGRGAGAVTYGRAAAGAAVSVARAEVDEAGIRGAFATPRGEVDFSSALLGAYNLDNLLAAVAAAEALALPPAAVAAGIAARGPLPGRMERVTSPAGGLPVFVDYAHTPAALEAALRSLKGFSRRKVILVFGCGGDRDPGKRPLMGRVAGELSDLPVATSDNPRGEDPLEILTAVEAGLKASGNESYRVVPDRREAIRRAVVVAGDEEWAVLIAGKGAETVQIVGGEERPFDDRAEVRAALEEKYGQAVGG